MFYWWEGEGALLISDYFFWKNFDRVFLYYGLGEGEHPLFIFGFNIGYENLSNRIKVIKKIQNYNLIRNYPHKNEIDN